MGFDIIVRTGERFYIFKTIEPMKSYSPSVSLRRARGFNLVELLVVIVIIAILASGLLGVSSKFREQAATTKTLNNLKQLQLASAQHAVEHNGAYPAPKGGSDPNAWNSMWFINPDFILGLGLNEADWDEKFPVAATSGLRTARAPNEPSNVTDGRFSIAMNTGTKQHWGSNGTLPSMSYHTSQINYPARAMAFCDANDFWVGANAGSWSGWTSDKSPWNGMKMAYRNNGKAAVVHFDGHASLVSPKESVNNMYLWDPGKM
ncbi:MAG: type II secretion system protein [Armatimonadetes bacterium]|nr:type II secretion system protein [Akkermansiaceae bacterium]